MTQTDITRSPKRFPNVVSCYVRKPAANSAKKGSKEQTKLSLQDKTRIRRELTREGTSFLQLKDVLGLRVSKSIIWRWITGQSFFRYRKRNWAKLTTNLQKSQRVQLAVKRAHYTTKWHDVISSDEKKFNLDGLDDFQYYWHNLRNKKQSSFFRQHGGCSRLVWDACSSNGTIQLAILEAKQKAENYLTTLSFLCFRLLMLFLEGVSTFCKMERAFTLHAFFVSGSEV